MSKPSLIAIDGPVASGKTTVGQLVAQELGYRFIDTGAMYRALTKVALDKQISPDDEGTLGELAKNIRMSFDESGQIYLRGDGLTEGALNSLDRSSLFSPDVDSSVSHVSSVPQVRASLVSQQRSLAEEGRVVMVGRDIGTEVLPACPLKIFLTASVEDRAHRRYLEYGDVKGSNDATINEEGSDTKDYTLILKEIERRDEIDSHRAHSPLKPASDAYIIDTSGRTAEQVAEEVIRLMSTYHDSAPLLYHIAWPLLTLFFLPLCRLEVKWECDSIPEGPIIVVANHLSNYDIPLMGLLFYPRRLSFVAKEELFRSRFQSALFTHLGSFPVHRGKADRTALRKARVMLERGWTLVIFPEGTRSQSRKLIKAHEGTALIAHQTCNKILPVGITGTETIKDRTKGLPWSLFRRPVVTYHIGKPVKLPPIEGKVTRQHLAENTEIIMKHIANLLPESYQGIYREDVDGG
ncbi:MAG: (d)CMP kinase [Chloroflexota bacterium]|nr:(d)CMP kinase [Chloroflexota bacterium]